MDHHSSVISLHLEKQRKKPTKNWPPNYIFLSQQFHLVKTVLFHKLSAPSTYIFYNANSIIPVLLVIF